MTLKDQILAAKDQHLKKMHVSSWGVDVYIRVMTVGERDSWELEWLNNKDRGGVSDFRAKFLARCLCDETGARIFSDDDVSQLAGKSASVCMQLFEAAMEHNALTDEHVEELAGN